MYSKILVIFLMPLAQKYIHSISKKKNYNIVGYFTSKCFYIFLYIYTDKQDKIN